jgi:SulP family sulfate permease
MLTVVALVLLPRVSKHAPAPLMALTLATVAAVLLAHWVDGFHIDTIGSRFTTVVDGVEIHGIPPLPPLPSWPWSHDGPGVDYAMIRDLLPAAFAIAMLGAIESLLSAVIADGVTGDRHDPNAELIGLGVGNVLCPFFGGIPATAAIARTAANIRAGARSPISSVVHAVFVLACTVALAPLVGYLPMAALAGLLLMVARNMSDAGHFVRLVRTAPRSDVLVLLSCFSLTLLFDMVVAVGVGVTMAALLFMRRMAEMTDLRLDTDAARKFELPEHVQVYEIAGPLFFGAAQRALQTLAPDRSIRVVVLDMSRVPVIDATGLVALESAMRGLERTDCKVIFAGVAAHPARAMQRAGIIRKPGRVAFAPDIDTALSIAVLHGARAQPTVALSDAT